MEQSSCKAVARVGCPTGEGKSEAKHDSKSGRDRGLIERKQSPTGPKPEEKIRSSDNDQVQPTDQPTIDAMSLSGCWSVQLEPVDTLRAPTAVLFTKQIGHLKTITERSRHFCFTGDDLQNIYLTPLCSTHYHRLT